MMNKKIGIMVMLLSLIGNYFSPIVALAETVEAKKELSISIDGGDSPATINLEDEVVVKVSQENLEGTSASLVIPDGLVFLENETGQLNQENAIDKNFDRNQQAVSWQWQTQKKSSDVLIKLKSEKEGTYKLTVISDEAVGSTDLEIDVRVPVAIESNSAETETVESSSVSTSTEKTEVEKDTEKTESTANSSLIKSKGVLKTSTTLPSVPLGVTPIDIGELFTFTGNGLYHTDHVYELTGQGISLSAQAWSNQRYDLTKAFSVEFYTYLGDAKAEGTADGIALAFHNNPDHIVGNIGPGMGVYGPTLGKASVLEFDTYYNSFVNSNGNGDADSDIDNENVSNENGDYNHVGHIAIRQSNENGQVGPHQVLEMGTAENPIANGEWSKVSMEWNPETSEISGQIGSHNFSTIHDIRQDLADPKQAIWGVTSSTGYYETNQGIFFTKIDIEVSDGELEAEKIVDKETVKLGDTVTYTIKARNIMENSLLENILVTDELPDGLELVADSLTLDGQPVANEGTAQLLKVTIPEIAGLAESQVKFSARVTKPVDGTIMNVATVTDPDDPDNPEKPEIPIEVIESAGQLTAEKLVDKEFAEPGETITYTIRATNSLADSTLKNVVITDEIPVGLELVPNSLMLDGASITNEGTNAALKVTIPEIKGIGQKELSFETKVTQNNDGPIKNIAVVTDPNNPTIPEKPEVPVEVIKSLGKLEAEKSVSQATAEFGEVVTYTIIAKNSLADTTLRKIQIGDRLPAGLELVADSLKLDGESTTNEASGNAIKVHVENLKGIGEARVTFDAKVTQKFDGDIINTAVLIDPHNPKVPLEPTTTITINDSPGELAAEKTVDKEVVEPGEIVTYSLVAKNILEATTLTNIIVEDQLPTGVELVPNSLEMDGESVTNEGTDQKIKVTIPEIKGLAEKKITFQVKVTQTGNGVIKNSAIITDPNQPTDPKIPEVEIEVVNAIGELAAEKLVSQSTAETGDIVTYTIIAKNTLADTTLRKIQILDEVPVGTELVADTLKVDGQTVANESNDERAIKVRLADLKGIGEARITFDVKITKISDGPIKNIALVTNPHDPKKPLEPEVSFDIVNSKGKLVAEKKVDQKEVKTGDVLNYEIIARNTLLDTLLTGVTVEDRIQEGLELVAGSLKIDGQQAENEGTNTIFKVTLPDIKGEEEVVVSFQAKVVKKEDGIIRNFAVVTDPNNRSKPELPAVAVTVVESPGQLVAEKTVSQETAKLGETVTYQIIAKNTQANTTLKNIQVSDTLPTGLELVANTLKLDEETIANEGDDRTIAATIPEIKGNSQRIISFEATVAQAFDGIVKNIAVVTDPANPDDPEKPEIPLEINESPGQLVAQKRVDQQRVSLGETVQYTIAATNSLANTTLVNASVEDPLPEGLELVADSLTLDGQAVANQGTDKVIKVIIPKLAGEETKEVQFTAKVTQTFDGIIKNIATVTDPQQPETPEKPEADVEVIESLGQLVAEKTVTKKNQFKRLSEPLLNKPSNLKAKDLFSVPSIEKASLTVTHGEIVTYQISAKNSLNNTTLTNVNVKDQLPEGLELVADSLQLEGQSVVNEGTSKEILVTIPSIKGGEEKVVTFDAIVTQNVAGQLKNIAVVTDPKQPEEPEQPEVDLEVEELPGQLLAEKTVDKTVVEPGETVVYTINVKNTLLNTTLTDVVVEDQLPTGISFVLGSLTLDDELIANQGTGDNINVVIPKIYGGETKAVSFKALVNQQFDGEVINLATVTDPANPNAPEQPEVPLEVVGALGELTAEKLVSHQTAKLGERVTYTIVAKNLLAETTLRKVSVIDRLPAGTELVPDSLKLNGELIENQATDNAISLKIADLKGVGEARITFEAEITQAFDGEIENTALLVDPHNPKVAVEPSVSFAVTHSTGKLVAEKLADKQEAKLGEVVSYTILARNTLANTLLANIIVEDQLPQGLELVSDSLLLDGETVENQGTDQELKVVIPEIKGLAERKVTFSAKVTQEFDGTITNVATVTDPLVPELPEHPKVPIDVVGSQGKLEAVKKVDQTVVKPGDSVRYQIIVSNSLANTTLGEVVVEDHMPAGLELDLDSIELDGQAVDNQGTAQLVKLTIPEIKGDSEHIVSFVAKVMKQENGTIKNIAVVTDLKLPDQPLEPEVEVEVIEAPGNLEAEKTADKEEVKPGERVTYKIVARNTLSQTVLKNVTIEDPLPDGLEIDSNSLKLDGQTVMNEGTATRLKVTIPTIEGLQEKQLTFVAKVTKTSSGTIKNIAIVTNPLEPDKPDKPSNLMTVKAPVDKNDLPQAGVKHHYLLTLVGLMMIGLVSYIRPQRKVKINKK